MSSQSSGKVVVLDFQPVHGGHTEERFVFLVIPSCNYRDNPERVHLQPTLVVGRSDVVEIVTGLQEAGAILFHLIGFLHVLKRLLHLLVVGHFARGREKDIIGDSGDTGEVIRVPHATAVVQSGICANHYTISVLNSDH